MRMLLATMVLAASAATGMAASVDAPACAALCGRWTLDAAASDPVATRLDAAMATYKEPRERHVPTARADDTIGGVVAEMERSIGPILNRPHGTDLRAELLPQVTPPPALTLAGDDKDILVTAPGHVRRFTPGRPHARVDAIGTARIEVSWKSGALVISEKYGRGRRSSETYSLRRTDGALLVTREVRRPGLKALRIQAVYHREQPPG